MRIALWIASPPTCSVLTPRAPLTALNAARLIFSMSCKNPAKYPDLPVRTMPYLLLWRLDKLQYGALHGQVRSEEAAAELSQALPSDQSVRHGVACDGKHVVRHLVGHERLQDSRPRPAVDQ